MTGSTTRRRAAYPRIAWFETLGAQTDRNRPAPDVVLPPPDTVRAERGRGQVTITWTPVEGAAGYLVQRSDRPGDELVPIHGGHGDVLAVPHGPYVDTSGRIDEAAAYAVASLDTIDAPVGEPSAPAAPAPLGAGSLGRVVARIDAARDVGPVERPWRPCIGSEHLALLLDGPGPGGYAVGDDLAEAFRIVRAELGVEMVRAHAIFHDRLAVYREVDGRPVYDFTLVDRVLERLLDTGLRPLVELSFVPHDLASAPDRTVFAYRGIISPPRDLDRWRDLVETFVRHLVDRFGRDEVATWSFEVWNEPNLQLFWTGSQADYFDLYDASVAAVKAVDPAFRVGGPSTSAVGWVDDLLQHCRQHGSPIDFVSTHTYGVAPLDLRPVLARAGHPDLPVWWTEWGVNAKPGSAGTDGVWAAPLVARGMRSAAGRLHALSYWVASDQFIELGVPDRLFHGGFGLLTIGNLRKPKFWAIWMLEQLAEREIACELEGDGAGSLVEAWASRDADRIAVCFWNGTGDRDRAGGDPDLERDIAVTIAGLEPGSYHVRHRRLDLDHSNIHGLWQQFGDDQWPDDFGWERLRERDYLEDLVPLATVEVGADGEAALAFHLPMPAISLVELERTEIPAH